MEYSIILISFIMLILSVGLYFLFETITKYKNHYNLMKCALQSILSSYELFSLNEITNVYRDSRRNLPLSVLSLNTGAYEQCNVSRLNDLVLDFGPSRFWRTSQQRAKKIDLNRLYHDLQSLEQELRRTLNFIVRDANWPSESYLPAKIYYLTLKLLNDYANAQKNKQFLIYRENDFRPENRPLCLFLQLTLNRFYQNPKYPAPNVSLDPEALEQYLKESNIKSLIEDCFSKTEIELIGLQRFANPLPPKEKAAPKPAAKPAEKPAAKANPPKSKSKKATKQPAKKK